MRASEAVSDDDVRLYLGKITSSHAFANTARLTRFLRFIVEARLSGKQDQIQEYVVGLEVFDKKDSFDPRIDSIVRVEGRRLRLRLEEYYRVEGRNDPVRIDLPKRGYIPTFRVYRRLRLRTLLSWAAVAASLAVLGITAAWVHRVFTSAGGTPAANEKTIGILPFENLSGTTDQDYFADGITDALTTELAKIRALRVISRTSTMRQKGSGKSLPEIARELRARYLLEGSVVKSGQRVRITAQLIDGTTDQHIWAKEYEREITDILRLQAELVREISREVQVELAPDVEKSLAMTPNVGEESYDAYLKGRYVLRQMTSESGDRSIQFFRQSIAADPKFAPAYAWLAAAHRRLFVMGDAPKPENMQRSKELALRAIELDPLLADAHYSLACCHALGLDWKPAGIEFRRALELGPQNAYAHHVYAIMYLTPLARLGEAESEIRTALKSEPTSLNHLTILGKILYFRRKYDAASAGLGEVLKMDPNYSDGLRNLGSVYVQQGMYDQAIAAFRKAQSISGNTWGEGLLVHALAAAGRRNEAKQHLRELAEGGHPTTPVGMAVAYLGVRNHQEAYRWLDRAREEVDWRLMFLLVDPIYDPLRSESRFKALLNSVGLD